VIPASTSPTESGRPNQQSSLPPDLTVPLPLRKQGSLNKLNRRNQAPSVSESFAATSSGSAIKSSAQTGPQPQRWAGAAFTNSPAPDALPIPYFVQSKASSVSTPLSSGPSSSSGPSAAVNVNGLSSQTPVLQQPHPLPSLPSSSASMQFVKTPPTPVKTDSLAVATTLPLISTLLATDTRASLPYTFAQPHEVRTREATPSPVLNSATFAQTSGPLSSPARATSLSRAPSTPIAIPPKLHLLSAASSGGSPTKIEIPLCSPSSSPPKSVGSANSGSSSTPRVLCFEDPPAFAARPTQSLLLSLSGSLSSSTGFGHAPTVSLTKSVPVLQAEMNRPA